MKNDYHAVAGITAAFSFNLGGEIDEGILGQLGFSRSDEAEHIRQMEDKFSHEEDIQACWNNFRAQRRALTAAMDDVQIAASDLAAILRG